jgi:hypothetical protein
VTTYYHRRHDNGEIVNASETDLSLVELTNRFPLDRLGQYYDPNPPLSVLQRYRYWDERP